ncbi:NAD(+) synthase [Exiguobacterium sp. U13-1]|uniref:NH(3)-dependent NAD(+) synthetase n=1 Tax=Exiguobacterium acetylicum TaxID=41170 RepID=A0ABX8G7M5_EXIAC|nr:MULTISPECIES: ammonia-dependent NAD(+) synthetase [Exiguobacterium]AOT01217.1 NAD(+) synthase [Exiguobacterium sp. U13-1]QWB29172.1 ammonia-dependent NAD(+) synthetase [Exiguobacterium acetylicum]
MQQEIIQVTGVKPVIDPAQEVSERVGFLKAYLKHTGAKGFVLGISGGQDSSLAGRLCQLAVEELRKEEGKDVAFYAVRLPYGEQQDEADAQTALTFIQPDHSLRVNIKPAVEASMQAFKEATGAELSDFSKGNTKARERMKSQYDLAAHYGCLVVGTDHAAEFVTGFYTKHGDGACDLTPLTGLNKRQGKQLLRYLNAPEVLIEKVPTADLEENRPALPDEVALGITYEEIDDYLEGKTISEASQEKLETQYKRVGHKHHMPVSPLDEWWRA